MICAHEWHYSRRTIRGLLRCACRRCGVIWGGRILHATPDPISNPITDDMLMIGAVLGVVELLVFGPLLMVFAGH